MLKVKIGYLLDLAQSAKKVKRTRSIKDANALADKILTLEKYYDIEGIEYDGKTDSIKSIR